MSFFNIRTPLRSTLFPYTTLFRSVVVVKHLALSQNRCRQPGRAKHQIPYIQLAHRDRKSTRLNSSHVAISYAVFCLKKKIYATIPITNLEKTRMTSPPNGSTTTTT